jgi:uncharacterized iron-regulated membrane protein
MFGEGVQRSAVTFRTVCVRLHRYAGLALAAFLTFAGLTGSILAFNDELDTWLNPELFEARGTGTMLPPSEIAKRVEALDPRVIATWIPLSVGEGESAIVWVSTEHDPKTGEHHDVGFNQVFVEPSTGEILGKRNWGTISVAQQDLIPFIYVLHYSLHLPGNIGLWIMGIVAMIWIVDSFVGAYLTFPRGRPFLPKWKPVWLIKLGTSGHRVVFDLHRAFGLWLFGLLLMIGISAVYLALPEQVFVPIISSIAEVTPDPDEGREHRETRINPKIGFEQAVAVVEAEGARRGWTEKPIYIGWDHEHGIYYVEYQKTQLRSGPGLGESMFYVDDMSGKLIGQTVAGEGTPADIFLQLQFPLHSGEFGGLPGRIAICITGLLVAALSTTGVVVWARKRRARTADRTEQHA